MSAAGNAATTKAMAVKRVCGSESLLGMALGTGLPGARSFDIM
jgi:hypothetical protein